MRRRDLIAALGVALWPGLGRAGERRLPLSEAFVMLDSYLALPPAERDQFSFAYRILQGKKPASGARAAFVDKAGARTPVTLSADGTVQTLPTLAQLKSKAVFEIDGGDYQFVLEPLAAIAPATRISVSDLAASLAQLNVAIAKFARDQGAEIAKLTTAYFPGVVAGAAVLADGSSKPLSVFDFQALGPTPYFEPRKAPGAIAVTLDKPPSRIVLAGPPIRS
jgi:hypothetical protein